MQFKWFDDYSVGVVEIDDQHKHFLDLLNECYQYVQDNKPENAIKITLDKILEHTKNHFSTEEKYFDKFNYEGSLEHKAEHTRLTNEVKNFILARQQNNEDIYSMAFALMDFLEDWLIRHLKTMDRLYTACFHEHGLY